MEPPPPKNASEIGNLPGITFRHLAVFSLVCREKSYGNAAVERRTTRANIKRVMKDFEEVVGRPLFVESPGKDLEITAFAQGLLTQVAPLARELRRLGDGVKLLHDAGRILRFAAPGDFFKGGMFSSFLDRLHLADAFRPCYLKIDVKRFRTALLNAECDVYFGAGLEEPERLDCIDFGPVPWAVLRRPGDPPGTTPSTPPDLQGGSWLLGEISESSGAALLKEFHAAGANGGRIVAEAEWQEMASNPAIIPAGVILLTPDMQGAAAEMLLRGDFPAYRFTAVMRRNHPYAELYGRLKSAAEGGTNGR